MQPVVHERRGHSGASIAGSVTDAQLRSYPIGESLNKKFISSSPS
jgi:hypothetical protein